MTFSALINMFWQHFLENKKVTFLARIPEQVYTAFLGSLKYKIFFRTANPTFPGPLKFHWNDFFKKEAKKSKNDGRHLL